MNKQYLLRDLLQRLSPPMHSTRLVLFHFIWFLFRLVLLLSTVNALQSEQSIAMAATPNVVSNTVDDIEREKINWYNESITMKIENMRERKKERESAKKMSENYSFKTTIEHIVVELAVTECTESVRWTRCLDKCSIYRSANGNRCE